MIGGRKPTDLSQLRCMVVDEADVFFLDDKNYETILKISNSKHLAKNEKLQWILFSATYPPEDNDKYERV